MPNYLFYLYLVNTIVLTIFFFLLRSRIKRKGRDSEFFWVYILSLLLPVIGLMGSLLVMQLAKNQGEDKRYIQHTRFQVDNFTEIGFLSMKSRESLPIHMGLQTFNDDKGKELVFQLLENTLPNQGRYLKAAVTKPSSETAHYAATALNMLSKRYDVAIQKMHQQVNEIHDIHSYRSLVKLYKEYIDSELLSDKILVDKKRSYQESLEKVIHLFPNEVYFYEQLVIHFWKEELLEASAELAETVIKRFSKNERCFLILLQVYVQIGDHGRLKRTIERIESEYINKTIPEQLQQLLTLIKGS
jgi:hypothetical protein